MVNNIKKNIAWNTFGSVFYSACQWVITIVVVYIASYETAGYLSLAMTTSSSFSAISLFSMRNYQVSDVKGEYSGDIYVGSRFTTCVIAFILCLICSIIGNSLFQIMCINAFMLVRVAEALVDVLHGENQKFNRYDIIGKSYILRGCLTIIIFVVGLIISKNLFITLFIMAICNLLVVFLYDWNQTTRLETLKPIFISEEVLSLLRQCVPLVAFYFLLSLENLVPKSVLKQTFGTEQLGIYSTIASPTLVVQVAASVAFIPLLPMFSEAFLEKKYETFSKLLRSLYLALIGMGVVVSIFAALLGRWGLALLFRKEILIYYDLFMPIICVTILTSGIWILSSLIVAMRQIRWLLIGMVFDFFMCLLIVHPCVDKFGKNGVSIVQIIVYALYICFMVFICENTLRQKRYEKTI